ncbi:UNKNOWN [Stylonychia lemnae]|uniref:Uncharacterized protein n=1 Tax=Stylonychia lemnae TaxID=5949 RepID=A0A078ASF2_STYLE|nr:UNKNOWN [Stylonychia lemnae]|eukprot:CDW84906.1 UNKNOWN [Stylonychia lemnae]
MLKSIAVSLLVAAVSSEMTQYHSDSNMHQISDPSWPPVHVAYNFKADFQFMQWEPTLKKLIPYANMNGTQLVDSAGNRERVDVWLQMDKMGMMQLKQVYDYNTKTILEHVPAISKCSKYTIPEDVNVGDILNQIYTPSSNITQYEGDVEVKWDIKPEFGFKVGKPLPDSTPQELLFNIRSYNLNYVQLENQPYLFSIPQGLQNQTFTDADFIIPECSSYEEKGVKARGDSHHKIKLFF